MSDFPQLETRITTALERIRSGLDGFAAPPVVAEAPAAVDTSETTAKVAELTAQLDEEKTANAQLEERVKLLKERQDGKMAELESNVDAGRARSSRMDRDYSAFAK